MVAAAGCGGMLPAEVAFAETAVRWWRIFSFFIAFDMMIEANLCLGVVVVVVVVLYCCCCCYIYGFDIQKLDNGGDLLINV